LLLCEKGAQAIEVCELTEKFASGLFPYWTWAAFPDLTEFWTPSFCDYVREIFMAQAVSINQMLDNAEQINKPQRLVDVSAIEDLGQLKYRRNGVIEVKAGIDINKAYQTVLVPSINTPLNVFDKLDAIQEKASGVTASAKGVADEDKVGIYKGNQENTADRFGFLNKSYSFGYKRFAKLWESGVREHLIKKVAIDILGPNGVETLEVSKRDIFRKSDDFKVSVEASNAEIALSEVEKQTKMNFLMANTQNPTQNPKKAYELQAEIAGFDPDTIKELQGTESFGTAGVMSEAMRDLEQIIDGENIPLNQNANTAYQQRFVDYMTENQEHLSESQFNRLQQYMTKIKPIVTRNMVKMGNQLLIKNTMDQAMAGLNPQPPGGVTLPNNIQ